jgi:acid ceramidase
MSHIHMSHIVIIVSWPSQWTLTELLRPLVTIVDFSRNGSTLYSAVAYAGYVGLLTGVRQGRETITVDSRFDDNYDKFLVEWLTNPADDAQLLTHMLREGIEDDTISATFNSYVEHISGTDLVGPSYAIVGGSHANEGAVVTLGPNMTQAIDIWYIPEACPLTADTADKFYVLETNYDHWDQPPIFDDRRTPAEDCMDNYVTKSGVTKEAIYNVLHASVNIMLVLVLFIFVLILIFIITMTRSAILTPFFTAILYMCM